MASVSIQTTLEVGGIEPETRSKCSASTTAFGLGKWPIPIPQIFMDLYQSGASCFLLPPILQKPRAQKHTHTHIYIYMYKHQYNIILSTAPSHRTCREANLYINILYIIILYDIILYYIILSNIRIHIFGCFPQPKCNCDHHEAASFFLACGSRA